MLTVRYSTRFKKDFKLCMKRHYPIALLQQVITTLMIPNPLPKKNQDHPLSGNYVGYRECHLAPDWLLFYQQTNDELLLYRTGSHADLFNM